MRPSQRAFSLIEVMVAAAMLALLLIAIGLALTHTLWFEARDVGRISSTRTAGELASRMREEARSSTAVFIPVNDLNGNSNADGHEIDMFRKSSQGGDTFVAYLFDPASTSVARIEYATNAGMVTQLHSDVVASGVMGLSALRVPAASMPDVVGAPGQVSISYGDSQVRGGNDVVVASILTPSGPGLPPENMKIDLGPKAAPTSLTVLVPAGAPQPVPSVTTIPFIIVPALSPPGRPPLPHGPIHQGNPVDDPNDPLGGIHSPLAAGIVSYQGNGTTLGWLDVLNLEPTLTDGTYVIKSPGGATGLLSVSCALGPCPRFVPIPIQSSGPVQRGMLVFQSAP